GAIGDTVVELAPAVVDFLSQPVHAAGAGCPGLCVDMFDQRSTDAAAASFLGHVQILQVAVVALGPAAAVVDEMHQADGLAIEPGERGMHGFGRVEKALPDQCAGRSGDLGLVETLVAVPQRQPGSVVIGADRADFEHGGVPQSRVDIRAASSWCRGLDEMLSPARTPAWFAAERFWPSFHLPCR